MIDTLRFKLLRVSSYGDDALKFLSHEKMSIGSMSYVEFSNNFRETKQAKFIKSKLTSASYDVNFEVRLSEDSILFEFSVPKYIFGNNIAEYPMERNDGVSVRTHIKNFILGFFKTEFFLIVKPTDIEIIRLDMCYNYHFATRANKDAYKNAMENLIRAKFRGAGFQGVSAYGSNDTVMYKTRDYSFKVYDKYEEFIKHDYEKIKVFRGEYEAERIRKESLNIMRSEITFRKRKLTYEFFDKIENQTQVSPRFKAKYADYKKEFNIVNNFLSLVVRRVTSYQNGEIDNFDSLISKLDDEKIKSRFLCKRMLDTLNMVQENYKFNEGKFRVYHESDFHFLLSPIVAEKVKRYLQMIAPKKIMLELDGFQKAVQRMKISDLDVIEFDDAFCDSLYQRFKECIKEVNDLQPTTLTPMQAFKRFEYIAVQLKQEGVNISISGIRKYLACRKNENDKTIVQKKIFSSSFVRKCKQHIELINKRMQLLNVGESIQLTKLPEVVHLE